MPTHFVLLVPRLAPRRSGHLCYDDHRIRVVGSSLRGRPLEVFEFEHFVLANVPASAVPSLMVEHSFMNNDVLLCRRGAGQALLEEVPSPPALQEEERLVALADAPHRKQKMRELLAGCGLEREAGERDIAYAVRLRRALHERFEYNVPATDEGIHLLPTLLFELGCGDCRAFNAGFVYALRASNIPARLCLGARYGSDVEDAFGAFAVSWLRSELFLDGVGWIMCDASPRAARIPGASEDGFVDGFGHAGSGASSFAGWHAAGLSYAEFLEASEVIRTPSDLAGLMHRLRQAFKRRKLEPAVTAAADELAVAWEVAVLGGHGAEHVAEVAELRGLARGDPMTPEEFLSGFAALRLGECQVHLGTGKHLPAAGVTGALLLEGGPYEEGVPLDAEALQEHVMVLGQAGAGSGAGYASGMVSAHEAAAALACCICEVSYEFKEEPMVPFAGTSL